MPPLTKRSDSPSKTMLPNRKMVVSESFYAIFGTKLPLFSPLRNGIFGLQNHAWDNWDN